MIYFKFQVDQLLKAKDEQIALLKDQLQKLNDQVVVERGRAQIAVDQMLYLKGAAAITPFEEKESKEIDRNKFMMAVAGIGTDEIQGENES